MGKNISVDVNGIRSAAANLQKYKDEVDAEMIKLVGIVDRLRSDVWIGQNAQLYFNKISQFRTNWGSLTNLAFNQLIYGLNISADTIEELQAQTANRIKTLGGEVNGKTMGISTSASGAKAGQYVDSNILIEDIFNDPNTKFESYDEETYAIKRNNEVIGYTLKENVNTTIDASNPWLKDQSVHGSTPTSTDVPIDTVDGSGTSVVTGGVGSTVSDMVTEGISSQTVSANTVGAAGANLDGSVVAGVAMGTVGNDIGNSADNPLNTTDPFSQTNVKPDGQAWSYDSFIKNNA